MRLKPVLRVNRRVARLLVIGIGTSGMLTGIAVADSTATSNAHRRTVDHREAKRSARHRRAVPFAVLAHAPARAAQQGDSGAQALPGAVLATTAGKYEILVWRGVRSEVGALYRGAMTGSTEQICLIGREVASSGPANGRSSSGSCGPVSSVAEDGIVDISESGPSLHRRVTVLVPNGVEQVTFMDRGGSSYKVKVTKNVVVNEDQDLAESPTTAVSFTLPNGHVESAVMPTPPETP
ncbi:MAG: hypothetical protein ACYCXW_18360 [Solirubrobacteraceae bacterium]